MLHTPPGAPPWPVPPGLVSERDESGVILSRLPSPEAAPVLEISPRMGAGPRTALLNALADEGSWTGPIRAWARSLAPRGSRRTAADVAAQVLRGVRARVDYLPDPAGSADFFARVPWILQTGADDCEGLSVLFVALARASGLAASVVWLDQPGAPQNHVSARVYLPGAGWTWAECSVPAALGEHPYDAVRRYRASRARGIVAPSGNLLGAITATAITLAALSWAWRTS